MLLLDFFTNVYRVRRLRGRSPETTRLYKVSIRNFAKTLGREPRIEDLTNDNVALHIQTQLDNGRTAATANKDRAQLLTIWRYATQQGHHNTWPDVPAEVEPVRVPSAWLARDLKKLFSAVDGLTGTIGGVSERLWWRTLLMVCLDTGERITPVSSMRWEWIEDDWVNFPAEVRKGGKRDRKYLLSQHTVKILDRVRPSGVLTGEVLPWPYSKGYLWKRFSKLLKKAGLPHGRKDKFHRLRKTVASVIYQAGLDATDALDHSHRRTTQHYLDPRFTKETQPSKVMTDFVASEG